jgi:hypothetical protein
MYRRFRVLFRRLNNVTKGTQRGMVPNKMGYRIIVSKRVVMEFEKKVLSWLDKKLLVQKLFRNLACSPFTITSILFANLFML